MANDLFHETTMSFGDHLEELRVHLWRALLGVIAAFIFMCFFANYVVKLITEPVESQQQRWYRDHVSRRAKAFKEEIEQQPVGERPSVAGQVTLSPDAARNLAVALGLDPKKDRPTEAITLPVEVPVGDLIDRISVPMAVVNRMGSLRSLSAQETLVIYFKAVLGASIVLASPWVFYQVYAFIKVGLYAHERRFVNLTLPFSVLLFLSGVAICYFAVFPAMLRFFLATNEWMDIEPETRLSEWVGFAVVLMLIFGVTFQMPLAMLMLERVGILSHQQLAGQRRMAIFVIVIAAAIITPGGDPNTLLLLAGPMYILFELGLFLMRYFERKNPFEVGDPLDELMESI